MCDVQVLLDNPDKVVETETRLKRLKLRIVYMSRKIQNPRNFSEYEPCAH